MIQELLELLIQYIRYMYNKRIPKSINLQPSQAYSINRNYHNQNSMLAHYKTQRKKSQENRNCLGELHINRFDSGPKQRNQDLKSKISSQAKRTGKTSVNINGSRWLDNQKEMMEFILNLKSKKTESKSCFGKNSTEEFQLYENSKDKEEFKSNRMLSIIKIQKHEKQAINYFYQKEYQKSFEELAKAQSMMKREKIDSQQHQLYISYLYAEFYYKLQEYQSWKAYLQKAKGFVHKLASHETASMKQYTLSVKALEVCLFLQEQQFQKVLTLANQLKNQGKFSSKIRRRIASAQIDACRKLGRFKMALELIDTQFGALQTDQELNQQKKQAQFTKLFQLKIGVTAEFISNQKAIELVESALGFMDVSKGQKIQFSYYNTKIYQIFADLLKQNENLKIKLIFFYQKWVENQTCTKMKLKIRLQLFKAYYSFGIYQRALQLFEQISNQNLAYLGPQYLFMFANIKHFNKEISQAVKIASKIVEICQDYQTKGLYLYKILEFNLEEQRQELRGERQILLQNFLKSFDSGQCSNVIDSYTQYLKNRGEADRAKKFICSLRKSGNLNINHLIEVGTNRRKSYKK